MKYTVKYADASGNVHTKVFTSEKEAVAAYDKLQSLKAKYNLSSVQAYDSMCCQYFGNGFWD